MTPKAKEKKEKEGKSVAVGRWEGVGGKEKRDIQVGGAGAVYVWGGVAVWRGGWVTVAVDDIKTGDQDV